MKVYDINELSNKIKQWKRKDKSIVFTNGCFDIFHLGHLEYLKKASKLGDKLIVAINSDISPYFKKKGKNRPYLDQSSRASLLASLNFVDAVILFDDETPIDIITTVKPDILVKGKDYNIEDIVGAYSIIINGGKVITIDLTYGYSTSKIIEKILRGEN